MKVTAERIKQFFTETDPEKFRAMMIEDLGEEADKIWTKLVARHMVEGHSIKESARLTMEGSRESLLRALTTPKVVMVAAVEMGDRQPEYPTSKYVH